MTFRGLVFILVIYALWIIGLVYFASANAEDLIKVKVTPRPARQKKTNEVEVISISTNKDGSAAIFLSACGAVVELNAPMKMVMDNDPKIEKVAQAAVDSVCR